MKKMWPLLHHCSKIQVESVKYHAHMILRRHPHPTGVLSEKTSREAKSQDFHPHQVVEPLSPHHALELSGNHMEGRNNPLLILQARKASVEASRGQMPSSSQETSIFYPLKQYFSTHSL